VRTELGSAKFMQILVRSFGKRLASMISVSYSSLPSQTRPISPPLQSTVTISLPCFSLPRISVAFPQP
jgi:hypothetical protein